MGIRTTFSGSGMIARHEALENDDHDSIVELINDAVDESEEFDPCFGSEEYV